jgi:hypothetical protein
MTSVTQEDPELAAMAQVLKTLESLDKDEARRRVIDWVRIRLGLTGGFDRSTEPRSKFEADSQSGNDSPVTPREGTVNMVAAKLGVESCRTLLVAAAAYLSLYQRKEKFSRDELVACAKEARAWKSGYGVQTSLNINRMCDAGELIEKSKHVYDLSQKKLAELEVKLRET